MRTRDDFSECLQGLSTLYPSDVYMIPSGQVGNRRKAQVLAQNASKRGNRMDGTKKVGLYIDSRFHIYKKSKYLYNQKVTKKCK